MRTLRGRHNRVIGYPPAQKRNFLSLKMCFPACNRRSNREPQVDKG